MGNRTSNQEQRILWLLHSSYPQWTPAPVLSRISLQYCRAISSLRKAGWEIENKILTQGGRRFGFYRLGSPGSAQAPLTKAMTEPNQDPQANLLLAEGETIAERKYRDPEEG
jgi:hypothetical protein